MCGFPLLRILGGADRQFSMTTVQLLSPTGSVASRVPNRSAVSDLTPKQQHVLDTVLAGSNVIVHGYAGSGKSFVIGALLQSIHESLECEGLDMTVYSNTVANYLQYDFSDVHDPSRVISSSRLARTRIIVLDEYVMVSTQDMHNLDTTLRHYLDPTKPFGGVQLVLVGDPFQLPPVSNDVFACSQLFQDLNIVPIVLDVILRQVDTDDGNGEFMKLLGDMRHGVLSPGSACFLDYILHKSPSGSFLGACARRTVAKAGNETLLSKISDTRYMASKSVKAYEDGNKSLLFHVGAPVQLTRNVYDDDGMLVHYNGQFGICKAVNGPFKIVSTSYGTYRLVKDATFVVEINGVDCEIKDCECAYYTTIHRLQGQTITQKMHIDLTGAPLESVRKLAYVAFSRVVHFRQISTSLTSYDTDEWSPNLPQLC